MCIVPYWIAVHPCDMGFQHGTTDIRSAGDQVGHTYCLIFFHGYKLSSMPRMIGWPPN